MQCPPDQKGKGVPLFSTIGSGELVKPRDSGILKSDRVLKIGEGEKRQSQLPYCVDEDRVQKERKLSCYVGD